jgi:hypothetical protein
MKKKLNKEQWEKLSKDLQGCYKEVDGEYLLQVEGEEDNGALRRAKDREKQRADELQSKLDKAQLDLDELSNNDARKKGDIKALETQWKKQTETLEAGYKAKLESRDNYISKILVSNTADTIASKISTVPVLMSKALRERMTVDFTGDEPKLIVLGIDGKPSDLTVEKLSEEFVANKEFSSIIVSSKASGGAQGQKSSGGANQSENKDKPASLASYSPVDLASHLTARKEAQT